MTGYWKYLPWVAIGILIIGLLGFNHVLELRAEEARRAEVSLEMIESGNYIVPQLHFKPYYNKPPFGNWTIAMSMLVFGNTSEWAVRLPGVLSLIGMAVLFYFFLRANGPPEKALLMAVAGLVTTDLLFHGSINAGEIDLVFALLTLGQVLSIYHFGVRQRWWPMFLWSYALMAFGVLTKGVPSIAFQGLTLLPFLVVWKEWKRLFHPAHFVGIGLFLVICGWYFWAYAQQEDVGLYLMNLFNQASERTASEHTLGETLVGLLRFPALFLKLVLPWGVFIVFWFLRPVRKVLLPRPEIRFALLFLAANLWLYWLSPQMHGRYLFMFIPIATWLLLEAALARSQAADKLWNVLRYLIFASLIIAGWPMILLQWLPLEALQLESLRELMVVAWTMGILVFVCAYLFWKNKVRIHAFWLIVLILAIARLAFDLAVLPAMAEQQPYRAYTRELIEAAEGEDIVFFGRYNRKPTLSLFGKTWVERDLIVPSELPYQVHYYYYQETGTVMPHHDRYQEGTIYYSVRSQFREGDELLNSNTALYPPADMVLFRAKSEAP